MFLQRKHFIYLGKALTEGMERYEVGVGGADGWPLSELSRPAASNKLSVVPTEIGYMDEGLEVY